MLHLLFAVRPTQEAHHFGIGIQGCQLVQVREHQWSEQQMFCLDKNQSLLMHRLLMSFLNQAFPEETGKNGTLRVQNRGENPSVSYNENAGAGVT
jgi:hypothetical protein